MSRSAHVRDGRHAALVRWMRAASLILVLAAPWAPLHALDKNRSLSQFHHTSWFSRDGAPVDIWALAQSVDGYLWLGTGTGLYRFDGVRFEHIQPSADSAPLRSNNITALTALPSGELWMGFYFPGGVSVLRDGHFIHYGETDGLPLGTVSRIVRYQG